MGLSCPELSPVLACPVGACLSLSCLLSNRYLAPLVSYEARHYSVSIGLGKLGREMRGDSGMIEIASRPSAALSRERDLVVTNNGTVVYRTASAVEAEFVALWIASKGES